MFKVSSTYPNPENVHEEHDATYAKSARHFATQSENYQLPTSIFVHNQEATDSEAVDGDDKSEAASSAQQRPSSSRASQSAANKASEESRKQWRKAAAKIVTQELTPYFKGTFGKPRLIESVDDFRALAQTLTDRSLEKRLHRLGEAVSFAPTAGSKVLPTISQQDIQSLIKGVDLYIKNQEQEARAH